MSFDLHEGGVLLFFTRSLRRWKGCERVCVYLVTWQKVRRWKGCKVGGGEGVIWYYFRWSELKGGGDKVEGVEGRWRRGCADLRPPRPSVGSCPRRKHHPRVSAQKIISTWLYLSVCLGIFEFPPKRVSWIFSTRVSTQKSFLNFLHQVSIQNYFLNFGHLIIPLQRKHHPSFHPKDFLHLIRDAAQKKTGFFGNFSQRGGGLLKSQNFCKFTKWFFVCQNHS